MSKTKKSQDSNDFWTDCLTENIAYLKNSSNSKKNPKLLINSNNTFNDNNIHNKNQRKKNQKLYRYNTKPTFIPSEIIKQDLLIEENNKPENNKKIIKSIKHMVSLYNKGMAMKETHRKNMIQKREKNSGLEKEKYSFKPMLYRNKSMQKKINTNYGRSTIYERGVKYQQKKLEKIAKLFEEHKQKDNEIYSFRPDITYKNLNNVFNSDNFFKEQADNDSNKLFLFRLMKAREEKEYKRNCLENNVNKKLEINWSFPKKLKRSVSQKDSLVIKRNLHDNILSLKCLETRSFSDNQEDGEKEIN